MSRKTGNEGEKIAAYFLQKSGYQILEQNYIFDKAEIDIICKKNNILVFVEVKTRKGKQFGMPEQSVTKNKQVLMARAADEFLYQSKHDGDIRYDIISIFLSKESEPEILHLEDAFFPIL